MIEMSFKEIIKEIDAWWDANEECRRAKSSYVHMSEKYLRDVLNQLPEKEKLHLRHTVFRINGLMYLYARLRKTKHNTCLGVLCGIITHLLDYFYDHFSPDTKEIDKMERVIFLQEQPFSDDLLQVALYELARVTWSMIPNSVMVRRTLKNMLATQKQTMLQMNKRAQIAEHDLDLLTVNKGHHSLCLYFSIANPDFEIEEAECLTSFGHYMQFMDDLEDFYEDQAEERSSTVSSVPESYEKATKLLMIAESDTARFYNNDKNDYEFARNKVLFYHNTMLLAFRARELTRHLPKNIQSAIQNIKEFLSLLIPFIYVAPVDYIE